MKAYVKKYELQFKRPARTSRGEYRTRIVWYLMLEEKGVTGVGECAPLPGLSQETLDEAEKLLRKICARPDWFLEHPEETRSVSSVRFALETARLDLQNGGRQILFPSSFCRGEKGIPVNGLVWMGTAADMDRQAREKAEAGFRCIKFKIGSLDFPTELNVLNNFRKHYDAGRMMLRVDANGAFHPDDAPGKLQQLESLDIHSVEQPIEAGQWLEMAKVCKNSPVPVALDEELIGFHEKEEKERLLDTIRPHFLILKPGLHGGLAGCEEWIELAEERKTGWWITSYLESNVGLNAIAQWAVQMSARGYQGLGTGSLFLNNIPSPLEMRCEQLWFNPEKRFSFPKNFYRL